MNDHKVTDVSILHAAIQAARRRFAMIAEFGDPFEILADPEAFEGTDDGPETVCMVYENMQQIARNGLAEMDTAFRSVADGPALTELEEK